MGLKNETRFFDIIHVIFYCDNSSVIYNELYKLVKIIKRYYLNKKIKIYNTFCAIHEFLDYYKCSSFSKNILDKSNYILRIFTSDN